MPKVMVSVDQQTDRSEVIQLVRAVTGLSMRSVAERLAAGRSGWLLVADFYRGDHDERAEEFKGLIFGLRSLGIEPFVVRVSSHNQWPAVEANPGAFSVPPESVLEMLDRQMLDD